MHKGFFVWDYIIFITFLAISLGIGVYHGFRGGRQRTVSEFLMADRKLKFIPVGLSLFVSYTSGISVLANPVEVYMHGLLISIFGLGQLVAACITAYLLVPLYYPLKLTSINDYLYLRYQSEAVRLLGTIISLLDNILYMGLVAYTPAIALQIVADVPYWITVIVSITISVAYTVIGGMKAVIYTDVFQSIVMTTGYITICVVSIAKVGGLSRMWSINLQGQRVNFMNWTPDPTLRLTPWSSIVGGIVFSLTNTGVKQFSFQRINAVCSLQHAKRSIFLLIPFYAFSFVGFLLGMVIFAYYDGKGCNPLAGDISNHNQLLPYFIMDVMYYPCILGMFLAILFSAAMSSISSSLSASAAVTWEDILKHKFSHWSDFWKSFCAKCLVIVFGIFAMQVAFVAHLSGSHLLQLVIILSSSLYGPLVGVILMGALVRRANYKGAFIGCIVGSTLCFWVIIGSFIYKPHQIGLPLVNHSCKSLTEDILTYSALNISYETKSEVPTMETGEYSGLRKLYGLSFMWYGPLGAIVAVIVQLLTSLVSREQYEVPDHLIIPLCERMKECLPKIWKRHLPEEHLELKENSNTVKAIGLADEDIP